MGGGRVSDLLLPALITVCLTTTPTGFSMMGQFCHSCFEITERTALAQFGHFTLKTRVWFQIGGCRPPNPPHGCATVLRRIERAMCDAELADRKNTEDRMDVLELNQTIDKMAKAIRVRWLGYGLCFEKRGW